MARKPITAVLDNNAWNDIVVRDKSTQLLEKLQQSVARGTVDVLVPFAAIEETLAAAATDGGETRRRLAYMRALGRGRVLNDVHDIVTMEVRGEPTDKHIFMSEAEASSLFTLALAASDGHGRFTAPADGKMYNVADIVSDTKRIQRERDRLADTRAEAEIGFSRNLADSMSLSRDSEPMDDVKLPPNAAKNGVLLEYGARMTQHVDRMFGAWVQDVLTRMGAPTQVISANPADHPFASTAVAYNYAHFARHLTNGTLWASGDWYDMQYCVLSVAGDILVSSDADLRRTYDLMPFKPYDLCSPSQLMDRLA